ncbi:MAG: VWA domain-containing protein [Bacteroidia bacterium]|nr:VWA domain-containing protein [Bacteroidia bacterium]
MTRHEEALQAEFDRFVEFGTLLDRKTRRYLVQYLQARLNPRMPLPPVLEEPYFQYFTRALDRLLGEGLLHEICLDKPALAAQVAADTLRWMRKAWQQVTDQNPHADEWQRLRAASVTPLRDLGQRWPYIIRFLDSMYTRDELDTGFYADRFERLLDAGLAPEDRPAVERIFTDLLAQWDALLSARTLAWQLDRLQAEEQSFGDLMRAKAEEFKTLYQVLSPFAAYAGRYWDLSRGLWEEADFDLLRHYDELLQDEASVRELADLLGRMREAEIVTDEETLDQVIVRSQWVEDTRQPAEIAGIHESDDLNRLLSAEASLLADPVTETVFLKKYADRQLLTFRFEDRQLVTSEHHFTEIRQRTRVKAKGPFIICVDTSDSMSGLPERIAKVICFAILKMAAADNRRAFLINFSVGIKTLDLYDIAGSLDAIAAFLRMSFKGGTDMTLALHEALRQLQTENYREADVLVVSDFIMYRIAPEVLQLVRHHQQNHDTRFHSLTLCDDPEAEVIQQFDSNWVYDPADKGIIRELAGKLRVLRGR